jgi:hypothetical protein
MEFPTMPHSNEKNSPLAETVAQEEMKIFSMRASRTEILLHDGAPSAQKAAEFSCICHCASFTRYLMPWRARKKPEKRRTHAVLTNLAAFCAFETGI